MLIFTTKNDLGAHLDNMRNEGKRIGLVTTMGALHQGHLSLMQHTQKLSDILVCSIFVNPTQFNNKEDLAKYPRPIEQDIHMLEQIGCDVLFLPEVEEMYSGSEEWNIDLDGLDTILEGAFRPGHFQGVTQIVKKLFDAVGPDIASFGQKDYQQFAVIKRMVEIFRLPVELKLCPTVRDSNGLAMSSRNVRLSDHGKTQALALSKALQYASDHIAEERASYSEIREEAISILKNAEGVDVEYFEICDRETLLPVGQPTAGVSLIVLVAAWVEGVRLIDNMLIPGGNSPKS
ncbi:pantoate--beta-alanine ligase [Albibacterium indicum]|uniref:pantoate--beta-alanine ligase n=1 Tax=Albibacterium indicum TaxID=2292082 RepID=UPI000E518910|nr:pantoate--beta-alanine ligase [Pedobacter indicus]